MLERHDEFQLIQSKEYGHLNGGIYIHKSTSNKFLIKEPYSEAEAKNEILAAKIYELAGVKTASLELALFNGKTVIISKWIEGYSNIGYNKMPINPIELYENYAIDAWLANWDVVGMEYDNIGFVGNEAIRIDLGGSLLYRGMGALKDHMFSNKVNEVCNFLNSNINYNTAFIFKDITIGHFLEGIKKIDAIDTIELNNLIIEYFPKSHEQAIKLITTLSNRANNLNDTASKLLNSNTEELLKISLCGLEYIQNEDL